MGWACSMRGENEKYVVYAVLNRKPERNTLLRGVGVYGQILLHCVLQELGARP
jgi:hypothetical protein